MQNNLTTASADRIYQNLSTQRRQTDESRCVLGGKSLTSQELTSVQSKMKERSVISGPYVS